MNSRLGCVRAAGCRSVISAAILGSLVLAPSCSSDDDSAPAPAVCTGTGGPVAGDADMHCVASDGSQIVQSIGKCETDAVDTGAAGAAGAADDETYTVLYGNSGSDDDCKYDVSFTNSCIAENTPVTFNVTLDKRSESGAPATGDDPNSPEVFLESDPSHITPSLHIDAKETSPGTYAIGPILFDAPGRWVVRFHFFENCSDVPDDSPHGHIAFYIDVP